ncbi:hypothetical protein QJS04_geneDACA000015 [Acorus gramineus]|uniref:BRCT domain-containing protein n=1 Tax=Acorus gramineus TaxID=55184 RepID=A0AAV9ATR9_ACOGR|nr:hypothetical protein QJS04_geneDACA000015 [Acorus gramineus]
MMMRRTRCFEGANVYLSRSLVTPELFDSLHDALRLNGAHVFLCCDPSRNSPSDYHVISSSDHEKFEVLRAKGCNLLGPQCILSCAKEQRTLPKQGYTCCLAMDGVKILASGFEKDDKAKIEKMVSAMGGVVQTKASLEVSFVIAKNVLATKYKWALDVLKRPIVTIMWLYQCWKEHRLVPQDAFRVLPFTGLSICVTRIRADERKEIESLIVQNGGQYSADLTKMCTHLISDISYAPEGDKYLVAQRWGHIHIVTRKWLDQSIVRRACLDEDCYPVQRVSVPPSNMKDGLKENIQDRDAESLQPLSSTRMNDPDTTFFDNICCTSSDASIMAKECGDLHALQNKDEVDCGCPIANDSEAEDSDLYLSNCRIFIVGFEAHEMRKLVNMVRKGGGSRHLLLSEKLTHIVVGTPSEIERREVRRLASWGVINAVCSAWLEDSYRAKKELTVSQKYIALDLFFPKGQRGEIVEWVKRGGGLMVGDQGKDEVQFIIAAHGSMLKSTSLPQCTVVSTHWIRFCLEEGCMQDVGRHVLYSPLPCHVPLPGFEMIRFCISQYEEKDRLLLKNLCYILGSRFTEKLSRKVTHLLCKFTNGPKYEAACKWGIQSVTSDWITDCIRQNKLVPLDPFRPKEVTSQDKEAQVCTTSQYPTQAAGMASGDTLSQLNESQAPNISTERTGNTVIVVYVLILDRSVPQNVTTYRSDSTKTKNLEDAREVPDAVPDVAAVIEDLLAESDMVRVEKQEDPSSTSVPENNQITCDNFSETQTESQVVGYEEDLSGRQKIIDRVRTQSTPSNNCRENHGL